jgi:CxxC motif-containing protein (DUF1111 family)
MMSRHLVTLLATVAAACCIEAATAQQALGRAPFPDRRDPPAFEALAPAERAQFELGLAVFNTGWVPAGQTNAARRDGVGPLTVAASCDGCHNNGARGRGDAVATRLSNSFVMQLGGAKPTAYGHVINTRANDGFQPEASIGVRRITLQGNFADGSAWKLFEPQYTLDNFNYGPLPSDTVLRPRIGAAVFGAGLLEAVPQHALEEIQRRQPRRQRGTLAGRFGWQADAASIADQTSRAFAREMGLTSDAQPADDCTVQQTQCLAAPTGGMPEVSPELFTAVVAFQRYVAVPERPLPLDAQLEAVGSALFMRIGCAICHQPRLPVQRRSGGTSIEAYTDLLRHEMGAALADRTLAGQPVKSLWRTAPLWGLAHALKNTDVALLHDGRARTAEEAILWHGGEAEPARHAFMSLLRREREQLLTWLATL